MRKRQCLYFLVLVIVLSPAVIRPQFLKKDSVKVYCGHTFGLFTAFTTRLEVWRGNQEKTLLGWKQGSNIWAAYRVGLSFPPTGLVPVTGDKTGK